MATKGSASKKSKGVVKRRSTAARAMSAPAIRTMGTSTYEVIAPSVGKAVLGDHLRKLLGHSVQVEEVPHSRSKVEIRRAEEPEMAELTATNIEREFAVRRALLATSRPIHEVRDLLGIKSRQTLHNWVDRNKIIALSDNGRLLLPLWQFEATSDDKVVRGLSEALQALKRRSFSAAHWFTNRNPQLGGRTPIELLRAGQIEKVVTEAEQADHVS